MDKPHSRFKDISLQTKVCAYWARKSVLRSYITEKFTESVIREMTRICNSMGGYNLSQGMPDFEALAEIKRAAAQAIFNNHNQYLTFGEPHLREAIASKAEVCYPLSA